jgi:hypothetical protein
MGVQETKVEQNVYSPQDIQVKLGIGRSSTYEFLRAVYEVQAPFRVIKVGKLLRVPKDSFDNWIRAI